MVIVLGGSLGQWEDGGLGGCLWGEGRQGSQGGDSYRGTGDSKDLRDSRESRESRDPRGTKDLRGTKRIRISRGVLRGIRRIKEVIRGGRNLSEG